MSHSVSPLGSLSSPSPSPPPNPIDESELSELTDDDPDTKIVNDANPSLTDDDDDDQRPPPRSRKTASVNSKQRQRQGLARKSLPATRYASRTASGPSSSKRKKRGGLVPAPMWDWAYKNGDTGSPTSTPPPGHRFPPTSNTTPPAGPSRPLDADLNPSLPPSKPKSASPSQDNEEEEEEELPTPPRAMEEEEGEEADSRKDRCVDRKHAQRRGSTHWGKPRKKVIVPMPFDRTKVPRSKRGVRFMPRINIFQHDLMLKQLWEEGYKVYDPNAPTSDEDDDQNENHGENEDDDNGSSNPDEDEMDVDEDEDAEDQDPTSSRQSPARLTLNTSLNTPLPSTSVIDPCADNPSVPPSIRASIDPTVSPPDEDNRLGAIPDEDVDQDHDSGALDDDDRHPIPDGDIEADADEDEDAQPEEPSQPPSPTPPVEPDPEPEPEDEDPDLQPAHRAEALDVLAMIELKFALLRERVYVEKMEGLAWEEALVWEGTHPELHHLQNELTKRRDKRLMLASKKRTYEVEAVTRKKREEETWCWEGWDVARIQLQTEMIAETNRKRRKLERERRTVERPSTARRIPNAILNPPSAPTLRQIANTFPLPSHLSHLAANKGLSYAKGLSIYPGIDRLSGTMAYPDLPALSPHDIAADLEFLFQHRRMGYGFGMGFGPAMGIPIGVSVGYNGTTTGFSTAGMGFGGPTTNPGFGVNGPGIGGPTETYPPNPASGITPSNSASQNGRSSLTPGGSGTGLGSLAPPGPSSVPSQNTPNPIAGPGNIPGPGIANAEGSSFSQPAMGVFQGPPPFGTGPTGYPLGSGVGGTSIVIGPGGTTSTPIVGPGGRIQRPSGFVERERELQRDREREMIQRDREARERELASHDREIAARRERELRDREREREFGPDMGVGPGYPTWGSKPSGATEWVVGDARRREEKERVERNERDRERERSQVQSIAPTSTHRHLHQHPHLHTHTHSHQLQQQPVQLHQPHPVHTNQSHSHQHSQHPQHHHSHGQHPHQHTQHQHGTSHAPPHHHVGQHHHHRHHHHVVHHHHSGASSTGPDGTSPLPQGSGPAPGVQTMEIINLFPNPSSKSHCKRDEAKLAGGSMPGSRPSSTHPLPPSHNYDERERERERERDRERERERDRPIATPFVLAPSHHSISSSASSPRHGWTSGSGETGPASSSTPSAPFAHPPERFHTPVPHRFSNSTSNGLSQLPRSLTTSPPRAPPTSASTGSPSVSAMNLPLPSTSSSTGPFPLPRKPSPALPKLGMPPLGYSPRLAGPGVVPPTGPGIPGVLSTTGGGPGMTASGILTSGPGVPPGPGIAPAPIIGGSPGDSSAPALFAGNRTKSPLMPYTGAPPIVTVSTQKVGIDGP